MSNIPRWARRVALVVISLILGFIVSRFLIIPILGTTAAEYSWGPELIPIPYGFLTEVSLAFVFGLILDKFLGTEILPK